MGIVTHAALGGWAEAGGLGAGGHFPSVFMEFEVDLSCMRPSLRISKSNTQPKAHPYRSTVLRTLMDFCRCAAQSMLRAVLSFRNPAPSWGCHPEVKCLSKITSSGVHSPALKSKATQHNTAQNKTKLEWNFKKYSSTQLPSYGKQLTFLQSLGSAVLEFRVNGLTS